MIDEFVVYDLIQLLGGHQHLVFAHLQVALQVLNSPATNDWLKLEYKCWIHLLKLPVKNEIKSKCWTLLWIKNTSGEIKYRNTFLFKVFTSISAANKAFSLSSSFWVVVTWGRLEFITSRNTIYTYRFRGNFNYEFCTLLGPHGPCFPPLWLSKCPSSSSL